MHCAQPVTPTGGDRDETPPLILNAEPSSHSIATTPEEITFYFDENVVFNNPEKNITISPLPVHPPEYQKFNKKLALRFEKGSFNENTTYSILFNDCIADLNEGNKGIYSPYLFSTGNVIDTLLLSAIIDYPDKTVGKSLMTQAYNLNDKNNIFTSKITSGTFTYSGLNNSPKTIVVFNDENNNKIADSTEDLGQLSPVIPGSSDTAVVKMYHRVRPVVSTYSNNYFHYLYGIPVSLVRSFAQNDSNLYYLGDTLFGSEENITLTKQKINNRTYIVGEKISKVSSGLTYSISQKIKDSTLLITWHFNDLITAVNTDNFLFFNEKDTVPTRDFRYNFTRNELQLSISNQLTFNKILINKGAIGFRNIPESPEIKSDIRKSNYAKLVFTNPQDVDLQGILESANSRIPLFIQSGSSIEIDVPQETYTAVFFDDANGDHLITAPSSDLSIQGEYWVKLKNIQAIPRLDHVIIVK